MLLGDCLTEMRKMQDNSIDFVVCDPPYGIDFMSRDFDKFKDQVAFKSETWREVLRIVKPGSMIAAFGGDRTHHHLMNALEAAGFEIRTCIYWVTGQSFPKSHNFGKQLGPEWHGYGTALKPSVEIIVLAMKGLDGTFRENAEKWGVAGINIDDSRVEGKRWPSNLILDEFNEQILSLKNNIPNDIVKITVKPLSLMRYILKLLAPPWLPYDPKYPLQPLCLDPFAGSGSTLCAAAQLGINCIGIEKDPEYYEIAKKRIEFYGQKP